MTDFFFCCYPLDLENEGIDAALSRLAGEIGVDAVSIAAVHPEIAEVRPRSAAGQAFIALEAAATFQPAARLYAQGRIRPAVAAWVKSRNPLEKIARAAERCGLKPRLALSACCSAALVARHPMAACINVFGLASRRWLCPSNPDVREYVAAVAEDLAVNYPCQTLELWDAGFGDAVELGRYLDLGVLAGPAEESLWSWCFCPSCRQRAMESGIDADGAARSVRDHLERVMRLEAPPLDSPASLSAANPLIPAYEGVRQEAVVSLVRSIRARVRCRLVVAADLAPLTDAARYPGLREHCDGIVANLETDPSEASQAAGHTRRRRVGIPGADDLLCGCCPPRFTSGPALVSAVHDAAQSGYGSIGFFNYGLAPAPCLDWVRQAIRYARREAAG